MLPSQTIDPGAHLPRLTVRELRSLRHAHTLDEPTFRPAAPEHGRGWDGRCTCGVMFTMYRSAQEIGDAHAQHVETQMFTARRAKARAASTAALR